jgi:hypothetical protein
MSALTTWHRKNVKEIAKGVIEIGNIIQNQSPNIKVIISELITRTNTPENRRKVTEVNAILLTHCKKNKWGHITNANIQAKHINPYGIHLNIVGIPMLTKNIISYLNEQH